MSEDPNKISQFIANNIGPFVIGFGIALYFCWQFWVAGLQTERSNLKSERDTYRDNNTQCEIDNGLLKQKLKKADSVNQNQEFVHKNLKKEYEEFKTNSGLIQNIPVKSSLTIWIISEYIKKREDLAENLKSAGYDNVDINPSGFSSNTDLPNVVYYQEKLNKNLLISFKNFIEEFRKNDSPMQKFSFKQADKAKRGIAKKVFLENSSVDILIVM